MGVSDTRTALAESRDSERHHRIRQSRDIARLRLALLRAEAMAATPTANHRTSRLRTRLKSQQRALRKAAGPLLTAPHAATHTGQPTSRRLAWTGAHVQLQPRRTPTEYSRLLIHGLGPIDHLELHCRPEDANLALALIEDAAALLAHLTSTPEANR